MSSVAHRSPDELNRPTGKYQTIPLPEGARVGERAPWADLEVDRSVTAPAAIRAAFARLDAARRSPREDGLGLGASAVLAPLFADGDDTKVLLTRRTMTLRAHRGEIAFPGGRREPGETLEQAARREAHEEIGLDGDVDIIGELDHLSTITSGSFIVPYVGLLPEPPRGLTANPGEVDAILTVKLTTLLEPDRYRSEIWPMPDGSEHPIVFFDLEDDTVWGATAAMLRQLLGFLTGTVDRGGMGHV